MAVNPTVLIAAKTAENSQTTQYTAGAGVRTIIDKFTATNYSGSTAVLSVNLVASGGSAADSNLAIKEKAIAAGQTYTFPEVVGHVLPPGGFISTLAGTASALSIRASGRETT